MHHCKVLWVWCDMAVPVLLHQSKIQDISLKYNKSLYSNSCSGLPTMFARSSLTTITESMIREVSA